MTSHSGNASGDKPRDGLQSGAPQFCDITAFPRGTLLALLTDAYACDPHFAAYWREDWRTFDDFFYDNPLIAQRYGLMSALDGQPIGFVSWDPRQQPEYATVGHNCILRAWRGRGFGAQQLREALRRMESDGARKAIVTSNASLEAAQGMYRAVGFRLLRERENPDTPFAGVYLDYELDFASNAKEERS